MQKPIKEIKIGFVGGCGCLIILVGIVVVFLFNTYSVTSDYEPQKPVVDDALSRQNCDIKYNVLKTEIEMKVVDNDDITAAEIAEYANKNVFDGYSKLEAIDDKTLKFSCKDKAGSIVYENNIILP